MRQSLPKRVVGFLVDTLNEHRADVELQAQRRPAKLSVKEYELLAAQGRIMIHYAGSKYSKPEGNGATVQERDMYFDCIVLRKSLRADAGEDEALDILEAVQEVLTGARHPDCTTALAPESDSFLGADDDKGILQYQARMTCRGVMVPPVMTEDELGGPLLAEVTPNWTNGD